MLTYKQAAAVLLKKYPQKKITMAIDYDSKWFIFMAVDDENSIDLDSPFYAVNKRTGDIRTYSPVDDLDNYTNAVQNRMIYSN